MKIHSLEITEYAHKPIYEKNMDGAKTVAGYGSSEIGTRDIASFQGVVVSSEKQLLDLVSELVPAEYHVRRMMPPSDRRLGEDESREINDERYFEAEIRSEDPDAVPNNSYIISVVLDLSDEPRREQVSLTISSELLRQLREGAEKSNKALSRFIDMKLSAALNNDSSQLAQAYSQTIVELELALASAKARLSDAMKTGAAGRKKKLLSAKAVNGKLKRRAAREEGGKG